MHNIYLITTSVGVQHLFQVLVLNTENADLIYGDGRILEKFKSKHDNCDFLPHANLKWQHHLERLWC